MNLKLPAPGSDVSGMFFSAASAPNPTSTSLRTLWLSLNKPVLAIDELPLGPARAAIAVIRGPEGLGLSVAIRSTRTDQVLFFDSDSAQALPGDGAELLDPAISFAEGMGFLFDDEPEAEAAASRLWDDWIGRAANPARPAPPARNRTPGGDDTLRLSKFRLGPGLCSGAEADREAGRSV